MTQEQLAELKRAVENAESAINYLLTATEMKRASFAIECLDSAYSQIDRARERITYLRVVVGREEIV